VSAHIYPPAFKFFSVWKIFPHISDHFEICSESIFSFVTVCFTEMPVLFYCFVKEFVKYYYSKNKLPDTIILQY